MESRLFIQQANILIKDIKDVSTLEAVSDYDSQRGAREYVQKRLNTLFSGLQNPTLPSAQRLAQEADNAGYQINERVLQALEQGERCWS